VNGKESLTIW